MIEGITAILGIIEGVVGIEKVRELKEYVSKWVDARKSIQDEMSRWPDVDTVKLGQLWKDEAIYEEAFSKQAALLSAAKS